MKESKNDKFKRLAKLRGERILSDLRLLANLSNRNNYEYSEAEVRALFTVIEDEMKITKSAFSRHSRRGINL